MKMKNLAVLVSLASLAGMLPAHAGVTQTFSAGGKDAAAIQSTVDQFRAALGANNGAGGPAASGRREINWDGVPAQFLDPLPPDFFNKNSTRGLVMSTSGSRLKVSGDQGTASFRFTDVTDQQWGPNELVPFSAQKLFSPIGSNTTDVTFFVPGTAQPANVTAFGAVFADVDISNTSWMELYSPLGNRIAKIQVPVAGVSTQGLSFVGAVTDEPVARVRLVSGNVAIDSGCLTSAADAAALDDFIYSEPIASRELVLSKGRIRATVEWRSQYNGETGTGLALPQKDEFGYLYFSDPNNPEIFVKCLDFGSGKAIILVGGVTDFWYKITFKNSRGETLIWEKASGSLLGYANNTDLSF